jgi:hypothetical protein
MSSKKAVSKNECTSIVGHFNGHASALEQYRQYRPMQDFQGYPGSHLTPAIGQLLAPYCPGFHQGDSKQNNDEIMDQLCWPF